MHLPTALPELWVTESPLGEPEPLLILRRHTRVPRQALPGPHGGREKAKTFPSVASDAGGPRSAKLQVWSCVPSHFSSPSGGGCIRQLQFCKCSVRLAHIPAHPVSLPSVMGTHWLAAAGESLGVLCHTELAKLLCWSLVDTGGMLSWALSRQKSRLLRSSVITADSSLSRPLSILRPPSETPDIRYPFVPRPHPFVWYLQRESECRWESVALAHPAGLIHRLNVAS